MEPQPRNMHAFGRLVAAYGPEFLAACFPGCDWLSAASRAARRENLSAELARLERRDRPALGAVFMRIVAAEIVRLCAKAIAVGARADLAIAKWLFAAADRIERA